MRFLTDFITLLIQRYEINLNQSALPGPNPSKED